MSDTLSETEQEVVVKPVAVSTSKIEVPYSDYSHEHGTPFLVDHFELGSHWSDREGGFPEEVTAIENYLQSQVADRVIENSLKAVKNRLKEIERVTNMDKEDRAVVKLEVMAEYVKFLMKKDDIKKNITRYS